MLRIRYKSVMESIGKELKKEGERFLKQYLSGKSLHDTHTFWTGEKIAIFRY